MADNVLNVSYAGTPAHGLYATVRRRSDGAAWSGSAYEAWSNGSISSYAVVLSSLGGGFYGAGMPSGITAETLVIDYFDQAGASPSATLDLLLTSESIYWNGATATPVPAGYTGRYTSVGLCKTYRGTINITQWSSTDGTGTEDTDAEAYAINVAEDRIDDDFGGTIYANPFAATTTPNSLTHTIPHWATVIATYELYKKRGLDDGDPKKNKLQQDYEQVLGEMQLYIGGSKHLRGVAYKTGATRAVQVVAPFENRLSDGAALVPTTQDRWVGRRWVNGAGWVVTN